MALSLGCGSTQPQSQPAPAPIVTVPEVKSDILWKEVSPETLDFARKEGKSLMVFFYSKTCAWCDLMMKTALQDPKVVERLNKDYVCMKLNAEKDEFLISLIFPELVAYPTTTFSVSEDGITMVAQGYISTNDMLMILDKVDEFKALKEPK